jgi:hypothetical protein
VLRMACIERAMDRIDARIAANPIGAMKAR